MTYPHNPTLTEKEDLFFGKKVAKALRGETPKKRKDIQYKEAKEQTSIAKYIKKHYPRIPVETVKHESVKAKWEQNQHNSQNTQDSFPDTRIYLPEVTLMFEQKALGKPPANQNGKLRDWHHQHQYDTHRRLFNAHTKVYFTVGVSEAISIFEDSLKGLYRPMQVFGDCAAKEKEDKALEDFFGSDYRIHLDGIG